MYISCSLGLQALKIGSQYLAQHCLNLLRFILKLSTCATVYSEKTIIDMLYIKHSLAYMY